MLKWRLELAERLCGPAGAILAPTPKLRKFHLAFAKSAQHNFFWLPNEVDMNANQPENWFLPPTKTVLRRLVTRWNRTN